MTASSLRTTDVLLHVIVSLLTPMFLTTTGNLNHAYAAAHATVKSCTARNPMALLLIGQMIALSLATLSSVSLSMEDNIPINLILRLRGNAVSLHRASEKCRRALPDLEPNPADAYDVPLTGAEPRHEAEKIIAEVELTQKHVAESQASVTQPQASVTQPQSTPAPAPNLPPGAAKIGTPFNPERNLRAACAEAFPDATQQEIDAIIKEAIAESGAERMHAADPNPTVNHLINGTPPPPGWPRTPSDFPDNRGAAQKNPPEHALISSPCA